MERKILFLADFSSIHIYNYFKEVKKLQSFDIVGITPCNKKIRSEYLDLYESLNINTAISQMMIFVNEAYKADTVYKPYAEGIVKMLSCITPHIGEEMWQLLGHESTIAYEPWPTFDPTKLEETTVEMVVQINGKVRDKMTVPANLDDETAKTTAQNLPNIKKLLADKTIKKIVVIKNKLVNIVAV